MSEINIRGCFFFAYFTKKKKTGNQYTYNVHMYIHIGIHMFLKPQHYEYKISVLDISGVFLNYTSKSRL
jgi:hypothetical protein